eukprot:CAMPEP_0117456890 /NCGR_PEP_ID=MMETSP0784-20121206/87_1 /TAXON_ID=39447 /ORGANISM="" /LENGTH=31 /DNA_ID= /DNA_START= /DNA_END= /DNA_ORIENTATION=
MWQPAPAPVQMQDGHRRRADASEGRAGREAR